MSVWPEAGKEDYSADLPEKNFLLDFQDLPALSEYHKKYQQGNTQRLKYHPVIHGNTWWGKYPTDSGSYVKRG